MKVEDVACYDRCCTRFEAGGRGIYPLRVSGNHGLSFLPNYPSELPFSNHGGWLTTDGTGNSSRDIPPKFIAAGVRAEVVRLIWVYNLGEALRKEGVEPIGGPRARGVLVQPHTGRNRPKGPGRNSN
jgi:hypothetical protein